MIKNFVFALAIAVMLFAIAPVQAAVEVGQPAPDFTATDIDGKAFTLSAAKGKKVVLEWTNAECPFVVKHYGSSNMQKTQEAAVAQGVEWVTINSSAPGKQGHVDAEGARKLATEKESKASVHILDESGSVGKLYDAKTTPHMFLIDENGVLVYAGAIDDNSSPDPTTVEGAKNYVLTALEELAAGKPVTTSTTQPYGCGVKYAE